LSFIKFSTTSSQQTLKQKQMKKVTLLTQSTYYLLTGIWPVIHLRSFMAVTGPKTDIWLVKMVALLTIAVGIQMLADLNTKQSSLRLPVAAALSFLVIDTYYALKGMISKIYLGDAAVQLVFVLALTLLWRKKILRNQNRNL
jgi:hypothetical protein